MKKHKRRRASINNSWPSFRPSSSSRHIASTFQIVVKEGKGKEWEGKEGGRKGRKEEGQTQERFLEHWAISVSLVQTATRPEHKKEKILLSSFNFPRLKKPTLKVKSKAQKTREIHRLKIFLPFLTSSCWRNLFQNEYKAQTNGKEEFTDKNNFSSCYHLILFHSCGSRNLC